MPKIKIILLITFLVFSFFVFGKVEAGTTDNVSGFAWSENIGWISFNCTNQGTCATSNYGVHISPSTGVFSGYAWSEHIGWITFNEAELSGCPTPPCQAKLDFPTKQVSGWAKALTDGGGWDGWIRLRDANYGVSWNPSTQEMEGWAWSDMVIGWISFNCKNQGVCGTSNYKVIANIDATPPTTNIKVKRKSTGVEVTGGWLRADTYTIQFEDNDEAPSSGWKLCQYYVYACDVNGVNCGSTPEKIIVPPTSRICGSWSFVKIGTFLNF